MKRSRIIIYSAAVMLAWLTVPETSCAQGQRSDIAFINLDNVFTNYNKTKLAEAQLKEQADVIKEERLGMIDDLKKMTEEYKALQTQTKSAALNDEARAVKRSEAETLLIDLKELESKVNQLEESSRRKFDGQSRRARKRLVDEINGVVRAYAKDKGLLAVIDISGESLNGVPTVIYYREELDVTKEIIALINE